MTNREFFIETVKSETPIFERVFRALPQDKLHHTHHVVSKTAGALAIQMADEALSFVEFLTEGKVDWSKHGEHKEDVEEITTTFAKGMHAAQTKAEQMTDADWDSEAVAMWEGKEVWKSSKGKMAWGLVFDLIHHRGQLSTYIRPMGGKVPSIYGPSADSQS